MIYNLFKVKIYPNMNFLKINSYRLIHYYYYLIKYNYIIVKDPDLKFKLLFLISEYFILPFNNFT